jgi:penicillin-binding protein 2
MAYASVGNGGDLWEPQLVERVEAPSGKTLQTFAPKLRRHLSLAPEHLKRVARSLCGVVSDPKGTAHDAYDPDLPVEVCGKTGTAQVGKTHKGEQAGWNVTNDHAWFASFAPAKDPELAVAVLIEHGGLGGHVAAPVAMDVYRHWFKKRREPSNKANRSNRADQETDKEATPDQDKTVGER